MRLIILRLPINSLWATLVYQEHSIKMNLESWYPPDHPILSNFNIPLIFVKTNFDEAKRKNVCPSECLGI